MEIAYFGLAILLFLLINAVLVSCELSLVRLRYMIVSRKGGDVGDAGDQVARVIGRADRLARAIRIGCVSCAVAVGLLLYPFTVSILGAYELLPWMIIFPYLLLIAGHYFFITLIPRAYALASPERVLRQTSWFMLGFVMLMTPFLVIMDWVDKWIFNKFNLDVADDLNDLDVEVQIRALSHGNKELSSMMRNILHNTFRLSELKVGDILLPRNQVQIFDLDDDLDANMSMARKTGHTRFPLCEEDLDHCIGIIHIKDVFRHKQRDGVIDMRKIKRRISRISQDESLENALQLLLFQKKHMALVTDEFGGATGVITLESILEELVGDIQDEFDFEEDLINPLGPDRFRIFGLAPIHDVEEMLELEIENEDVSTFGGLITAELGRIPDRKEVFAISGLELEITVEEVDEKRVISTTVRVLNATE